MYQTVPFAENGGKWGNQGKNASQVGLFRQRHGFYICPRNFYTEGKVSKTIRVIKERIIDEVCGLIMRELGLIKMLMTARNLCFKRYDKKWLNRLYFKRSRFTGLFI